MNKRERIKIAPLNTLSGHDKGMVINDEMAKKFKDEIIGTPLMYSEDNPNLPHFHKDREGNRRVIGNAIGSDIITDENGVQYLVGDYEIYTDANRDIMDKMKEFNEDSIGASYEIFVDSIDKSTGEIKKGNYKGTSIMDIDHSAYGHRALLVASKSEGIDTMEIKYDDMLKEVIGKEYKTNMDAKDKEIIELKKQIENASKVNSEDIKQKITDLESRNEVLLEEVARLRDLNESITDLT